MRRPSAAASSAAGILPSTFSKPVRVSTRRVHRYHLPTAETPPTQTPTFFPKSGHDFIFSSFATDEFAFGKNILATTSLQDQDFNSLSKPTSGLFSVLIINEKLISCPGASWLVPISARPGPEIITSEFSFS